MWGRKKDGMEWSGTRTKMGTGFCDNDVCVLVPFMEVHTVFAVLGLLQSVTLDYLIHLFGYNN